MVRLRSSAASGHPLRKGVFELKNLTHELESRPMCREVARRAKCSASLELAIGVRQTLGRWCCSLHISLDSCVPEAPKGRHLWDR